MIPSPVLLTSKKCLILSIEISSGKKLEKRLGLSGNVLLAVKAIYEDVRCSIDINHTHSD